MLHVAVAGAGVGGLTAALALADAGCRVDVFEQAAAPAEIGAGVQLSPNATLVLERIGVLDTLRAAAVAPEEVLIRRAADGAALAHIPLGPPAAARYGAPFLVVRRADLQAALAAAAARRSAVRVHFGCGVVAVETVPSGVRVRFADTRRSPVDVGGLVAADGIRSIVRRQLFTPRDDDARPAGRSAWRSLVPAAAADADALVARSNLWLGRRAHLVHYPVDAGRSVNVVAIVDTAMRADDDAFWSAPGESAVLEEHFAAWAAPARRLIGAAPGWRRWPLFDRAPLARWSRGAVTLLGDAAHPMLPFLAQGAAQAIEDAAVLAVAVRQVPDDLAAAFLRYERLRQGRTARVQRESRRQATIYHLGGVAAAVRDMVLSRLGPDRLAARYNWLYDAPTDVRRFAKD